MINSLDGSNKLAIDTKAIGELKESARQNSPEALKATAKQFEALFMNMVMKSMREASSKEGGPFDSEQSRMYTAMLDQQVSQSMASRGVGLADMLIRQLSNVPSNLATQGEDGVKALPADAALPSIPVLPTTPAAHGKSAGSRAPHVVAFQDRLREHAEEASRVTGVPAKFMLGQAALESGWGKREIVAADGTASHNLFGIKATANWKGKVVERPTTEYVNGVAHTKMQKFRVYDSYAEGFKDYANLLRKNPRYENVLANAQDAVGFAQGLQRAGYATDPKYAAKLTRIINQTLSA